jgi:hypothetical protein
MMGDDDTAKVVLPEIDEDPDAFQDGGVDQIPMLTGMILEHVVERGLPIGSALDRLLKAGAEEEIAERVVLAVSYGLRFVSRHIASARSFKSSDLVAFLAERGIPRELGARVAEGFESFGQGLPFDS